MLSIYEQIRRALSREISLTSSQIAGVTATVMDALEPAVPIEELNELIDSWEKQVIASPYRRDLQYLIDQHQEVE